MKGRAFPSGLSLDPSHFCPGSKEPQLSPEPIQAYSARVSLGYDPEVLGSRRNPGLWVSALLTASRQAVIQAQATAGFWGISEI